MAKETFKNITAGLCFAVLILALAVQSADDYNCRKSCSSVVRFHVIANSDKDRDIAIKNTLAKELCPEIQRIFKDCADKEAALDTARESKVYLEQLSYGVLKKYGCNQKVKVTLSDVNYETRMLDGIIYPEGKYSSLRIILGEGKGSNWWCVLFSPMTDAGIEREALAKDDGKVKIKLKILELFK